MSISSWQTKIQALFGSSIAGGNHYLQMLPTELDGLENYVVIKPLSYEPTTLMDGTVAAERVLAVFECYAKEYDDAVALRDQVAAALDGDATMVKNREPSPGEEMLIPVGLTMEPLYYGFWV